MRRPIVTKRSTANANAEKNIRPVCRRRISTSARPCCESLRQQHPNNSKQHGALAKMGNMQVGLETLNQQRCSPGSWHSIGLAKALRFVKAVLVWVKKVTAAIRKLSSFLDSKKWSSPVFSQRHTRTQPSAASIACDSGLKLRLTLLRKQSNSDNCRSHYSCGKKRQELPPHRREYWQEAINIPVSKWVQRRPAHAKPDFHWLSGPRNGTWKCTCGISCLRSLAPMRRLQCSTTQATFTNPSLLRATPLLRGMF